jgi:cytochrome oxidase Cu insertion factor (SCO1/SenC/PrrC family)
VISIVLEHLILLMKQVVAWVVPDTPAWVDRERTRAAMLHVVAEKKKAREDKAKLEKLKQFEELQAKAYKAAYEKLNGGGDTDFQKNDKDHTRTI